MMRVFSLLFVAVYALLVSTPALADIASGTPLFTVILPTQDVGTPPAPIPPWGSTGPNAMQFIKLFCDGGATPRFLWTAPTTVPSPAVTKVTWQSALNDFSVGTHSCYATGKLYSLNESLPGNVVNFTIARPIYDPVPPVTAVQ
jgi:hypothetical protein